MLLWELAMMEDMETENGKVIAFVVCRLKIVDWLEYLP